MMGCKDPSFILSPSFFAGVAQAVDCSYCIRNKSIAIEQLASRMLERRLLVEPLKMCLKTCAVAWSRQRLTYLS